MSETDVRHFPSKSFKSQWVIPSSVMTGCVPDCKYSVSLYPQEENGNIARASDELVGWLDSKILLLEATMIWGSFVNLVLPNWFSSILFCNFSFIFYVLN